MIGAAAMLSGFKQMTIAPVMFIVTAANNAAWLVPPTSKSSEFWETLMQLRYSIAFCSFLQQGDADWSRTFGKSKPCLTSFVLR